MCWLILGCELLLIILSTKVHVGEYSICVDVWLFSISAATKLGGLVYCITLMLLKETFSSSKII